MRLSTTRAYNRRDPNANRADPPLILIQANGEEVEIDVLGMASVEDIAIAFGKKIDVPPNRIQIMGKDGDLLRDYIPYKNLRRVLPENRIKLHVEVLPEEDECGLQKILSSRSGCSDINEMQKKGQRELHLGFCEPDTYMDMAAVKSNPQFGQQLSAVPDAIGTLNDLQRLDLQNHRIMELPNSITKLTALTSIRLGNNMLSALPEEFGKLVNLNELDVHTNKLSKLPCSFANLGALQILAINDNMLEILPDDFDALKNLHTLDLEHNKLDRLPDSFCNLPRLVILKMDHNPIDELPNGFARLVQIDHFEFNIKALKHEKRAAFIRNLPFHIRIWPENIYMRYKSDIVNCVKSKLPKTQEIPDEENLVKEPTPLGKTQLSL